MIKQIQGSKIVFVTIKRGILCIWGKTSEWNGGK